MVVEQDFPKDSGTSEATIPEGWMSDEVSAEIKAFHEPKYFLSEILDVADWLYPWQYNTFVEFYNGNYKEFVGCVGQRCLHPDTKVLTSDGSYRKVKNLDDGDILYGMTDGKIKTDNCLVHKNEEEKRIVEVETWTGRKIKLSYDHRVYTQRGLVKAEELEKDDAIYVPYKTDSGYINDPKQAKVLGYMIGDGTFRHALSFSQEEGKALNEFEDALEKRYNCELKYSSGYDYYIVGKEYRNNELLKEVKDLGLWMKYSHNKFVPDRVFRYGEESLIEFLRAYFICDGSVSKDGFTISLSSVSGRLLRDTSKLLLKLGIRSYIDYKTHKHGYRLIIRDRKRFKNKIGDFRENKISTSKSNNTSPIDKLPFSGTKIGIDRQDVRYDGIRISNNCNLTNERLKEISELEKFDLPEFLQPIINEEAFFDRIVNVKEIGKSKTYDITMPKLGNFFAEDVLIKNSGKTLLGSLFATYELFKMLAVKKPNTYFGMPKGSDIYIQCVASNQQQAKDTVFSEIESRIENCEWFKNKPHKKRSNDYEFFTDENSLHIRAEHSNSSSLAGHTSKIAILDEVSRFKESTGGERSIELVYDTMKRTLTTFGQEGKMISISSPLYKDGFLMNLLRYGKDDPNIYTVHKATWEVNPDITKEDLQGDFDRDPEGAWRDYGAQPPESLESYFKEPERIPKTVDEDLPIPESEYELPELDPINEPCFMAGDPAFKNDRFGIAMAYYDLEEEIYKVPFAHSFEPKGHDIAEIDATRVVQYIKDMINKHNVVWFFTDIWNYPSALNEIRKSGVRVEQNTVSKKEYDALKEKIYECEKEGKKMLPPNDLLLEELKMLELHKGRKVDHPKRGSKDVTDAVANAVANAIEQKDNMEEPMAMVV